MIRYAAFVVLILFIACDNKQGNPVDLLADQNKEAKDTFIRKTFIDTIYKPYVKRGDSLIVYEHKAIIINPSVPDTETVEDINFIDLKKRTYTAKEKEAAYSLFEESSYPDFKKEFASKVKDAAPQTLSQTLWAQVNKYDKDYFVLDNQRGYLKFDGKFIFVYGQNAAGLDFGITSVEEASSNHHIFSLVTGDPFNSKNQTRKASMQVKFYIKNKSMLIVKIQGPETKSEDVKLYVPFDSLGNYKHIYASFLLNNNVARPFYEMEFEPVKW